MSLKVMAPNLKKFKSQVVNIKRRSIFMEYRGLWIIIVFLKKKVALRRECLQTI